MCLVLRKIPLRLNNRIILERPMKFMGTYTMGRKDIEVAKINIKEADTFSEEYPKTKLEDENIIDMEDISLDETNKEAMTEIITANSKEEKVMEKMKISLIKRIPPCV